MNLIGVRIEIVYEHKNFFLLKRIIYVNYLRLQLQEMFQPTNIEVSSQISRSITLENYILLVYSRGAPSHTSNKDAH